MSSNKYIIPVCDIRANQIWNYVIIANSIKECEEKLVQQILEEYETLDDNSVSYDDFIGYLFENDILVGDIQDIEEL